MVRNFEQLPLVFEHEPQTGRDDLLVSERLKAAVSIIDSWPRWPSPVVILAGPVGSGKSHLAAIWRENSAAAAIHPTVGSHAADVAATKPVLFEDADRRGFDDRALFHVINSVRENGTSLLIKLLSDRQLAVDDRLIGYIVARMERSLESAQTIVERLDHLALARGTRINRTLASEVLDAVGKTREID
jgi:chromosomal replication initiation ATPase DnaA